MASEQEKFRIIYVGEDAGQWEDIKRYYSESYGHASPEFEHFWTDDPKKVQGLIMAILVSYPSIVYVDCSKMTSEYLELCRNLKRSADLDGAVVCGLLDYLSDEKLIKDMVLTGVDFCHVKGGEQHDSIYGPMLLFNESMVAPHEFATAELTENRDSLTGEVPVKIGRFSEDHICFESSVAIPKGKVVEFQSVLLEKKTIRSGQMKVGGASKKNLYYDLGHQMLGGLRFIDPAKYRSDDEAKQAELDIEKEHDLKLAKKAYGNWLIDNADRSKPKFVRVLVVDSDLTLFRTGKRVDSRPFLIRCRASIVSAKELFDSMTFDVIIFQFDSEERQENQSIDELEKNDAKALVRIIKEIRKAEEPPYVVVYNSRKFTTEALQMQLKYKRIVGNPAAIDFDGLNQVMDLFSKKVTKFPPTEQNSYYPPKGLNDSLGTFDMQLEILKISESDVYFKPEMPLEPGAWILIRKPVPFYIRTVVSDAEVEGIKESGICYGLICGINEDNKKNLRQYVNSIFFRDLEAAKDADKQEIEALKAQYAQPAATEQSEASESDADDASDSEEAS